MPQLQSRGYYFSGNSGSVLALEGGWQMSQQGSPGRQDGDYYGVKHGNRQRDRCGPSEQRYMYSIQEFSNHWLLSTDIIRQVLIDTQVMCCSSTLPSWNSISEFQNIYMLCSQMQKNRIFNYNLWTERIMVICDQTLINITIRHSNY